MFAGGAKVAALGRLDCTVHIPFDGQKSEGESTVIAEVSETLEHRVYMRVHHTPGRGLLSSLCVPPSLRRNHTDEELLCLVLFV